MQVNREWLMVQAEHDHEPREARFLMSGDRLDHRRGLGRTGAALATVRCWTEALSRPSAWNDAGLLEEARRELLALTLGALSASTIGWHRFNMVLSSDGRHQLYVDGDARGGGPVVEARRSRSHRPRMTRGLERRLDRLAELIAVRLVIEDFPFGPDRIEACPLTTGYASGFGVVDRLRAVASLPAGCAIVA